MKQTRKLAFSGVVAALSTALMFLTGLFPTATLALPALAGCLLIPVAVEAGLSWGFGVYAVCSAISFLLVPDREAMLIYLLFFGYYPVLYALLGRIRQKVLRMALKLVIFNAAVLTETALSVFVLGIPLETISFLGPWTPWVLLALANGVFLLYDSALIGLVRLYLARLHRQVQQLFRM